jgi:transposase|tara:strand:+ start:760 stop:897 length:138 start_codon:yes stop_codon:yes gene_type:complete
MKSRFKVKRARRVLISVLYRLGVKPRKMVNWFGVSRATIYRHIKR